MEGPPRLPSHEALAAAPAWRRESLTWFISPEDGALLLRRQRRWERVAPLPPADAAAVPGTLPDPLPLDAPPEGAVEIARFQGRIAELAPGMAWREGRIITLEGGVRIARLTIEGPVAATLDLARRVAADLPLLPARASLHETALALSEGRATRPRRQGPPLLGGECGVEEGLRGALGHLIEVVLTESTACTVAAGPRGVHQTRVALRRLRSLLRIFRPVADGPDWRRWDAALRDLARVLGAARDWDVFLAGIGPACHAALGQDPRLRRLLRAAEGQREAAYGVVAQALSGAPLREVVWLGLALLLQRPEGQPDAPLPPFAGQVLRARWRRLRRAGKAMAELDAEALHEMRLDAKRLRYAAEPFAPIWPGKAGGRFIRRLAGLQDALGLANDAAVARGLAESLEGRGAGGFAIGAVSGFAAGRAEHGREAALEAWARLAKQGPFWRES